MSEKMTWLAKDQWLFDRLQRTLDRLDLRASRIVEADEAPVVHWKKANGDQGRLRLGAWDSIQVSIQDTDARSKARLSYLFDENPRGIVFTIRCSTAHDEYGNAYVELGAGDRIVNIDRLPGWISECYADWLLRVSSNAE